MIIDNDKILHVIKLDNEEMMQKILQSGIDVNHNIRKVNLIAIAVFYSAEKIVNLLLEKGANPNVNDSFGPILNSAIRYDHECIIEALIEHGADINKADENGRTPYMLAAHTRNTKLLKKLAKLGAKVDAVDEQGKSALHYACFSYENNKAIRIVLANCPSILNQKDDYGRTALDITLSKGDKQAAAYLRKHGAEQGQNENERE